MWSADTWYDIKNSEQDIHGLQNMVIQSRRFSTYQKICTAREFIFNAKIPSCLITDSVLEQRVHPWHGRIFEYVLEKNPNTKTYFLGSVYSGHGSGSDLKDSANYLINIYTFFANALKLKIN